MSYQTIDYFEDLPVGIEVKDINFYPWHRQQDVLEILFVLKGTLDITMSCDHFMIGKSEIAVMNNRTFHNIKGINEENTVISLYLDLNYYEQYYKYIKYTIFILEPHKYDDSQKQAVLEIKDFISQISIEMNTRPDGYKDNIRQLTLELLERLISNFNEVRYYNKKIKSNSLKMERYSLMMKYLNEKFSEKTLLEDISANEFFCKSYLLHLFRDVSTFSLKDTICFIRNWKSEEMLLTTKKSISEISDECGYSDTKYYYRHFKKWYQCTPAEYRRKYRAELNSKPVCMEVPMNIFVDVCQISDEKQGNNRKKYALIYPFMEKIAPGKDMDQEPAVSDWDRAAKAIDSCTGNDFSPCIVIRYKDKTQLEWEKIITQCVDAYGSKIKAWEFWITYDVLELTDEINQFINRLESLLNNIKMKSMMLL